MSLEEEARGAAASEERLTDLLEMILRSAVDVLGFDAGTITARTNGGDSTVAATDQRMVALDDTQYQSGAGPCLEALAEGRQIVVDDAAADDRWQEFQQTAEYLGVHTTLSSPLDIDTNGMAASMNLYARRRMDLGQEDLDRAVVFAEQLAAALESAAAYRATAKLAGDIAAAMRTRGVIEQAKGMIMADHGVTPDEAFELLRKMSQRNNVKVAELATRIVERRTR